MVMELIYAMIEQLKWLATICFLFWYLTLAYAIIIAIWYKFKVAEGQFETGTDERTGEYLY